jgi:hypothetical protein
MYTSMKEPVEEHRLRPVSGESMERELVLAVGDPRIIFRGQAKNYCSSPG